MVGQLVCLEHVVTWLVSVGMDEERQRNDEIWENPVDLPVQESKEGSSWAKPSLRCEFQEGASFAIMVMTEAFMPSRSAFNWQIKWHLC